MEIRDTLGVVPAWIEAHCVIPDGDDLGLDFTLGSEQYAFVATHYQVKSTADLAHIVKPADAFKFRRSQLVRAQKWGKSPLIAAFVCAEGVGPVVFNGRASGGEWFDCRDFGCGCGWGADPDADDTYTYERDEPMGRRWSTPLIQITATSEDQTDNTYDALRPMIDRGPLADLIPKTGEEFIRLPGGGRIDVVTSKATSRLGQRITFSAQDETGLWVESNGGWKLAKTQRRGLAGMGGRSIETTNAWDPSQNSVAQRTFESLAADINKDFQQPPAELSFKNKADRKKIFAYNYRAAPWVSQGAIEAEAAELLEKEPADAERFFGNRIVSGDGSWFQLGQWDARKAKKPVEITGKPMVCGGFDGSDNNDWTGIRLETVDQYQLTPEYTVGDAKRPTLWKPSDWQGRIPHSEVMAAFDWIEANFTVVRFYLDPQFWETEIDLLAEKYGAKKYVQWPTNQINRMYAALERIKTDVTNPDSAFSHDGDPTVSQHVNNAIMRARPGDKYIIGKPSEHQKIDQAMSSTLAHEATMDAIAAGDFAPAATSYVYY